MKQRAALAFAIVMLALWISACSCGRGHDGETFYLPPAEETTTYLSLISASKEEPPQWTHINKFWLASGERGFSSSKAGVYLEVAAEVEAILADHTLRALEMPESAKSYDAYAKSLFSGKRMEMLLFVYLAAGPGPNISKGEFFLSGIRLYMLDHQVCYVEVCYTAKDRVPDVPTSRYVYCLEDAKVIAELWDWADGRMEEPVLFTPRPTQ